MGVFGVKPTTGADAGCGERNPQRVCEIPHCRNDPKKTKKFKETDIDLKAYSMWDNLVFSAIPEQAEEDPKSIIKNSIQTQLKLPEEMKNIFHSVHRLGGKRHFGCRGALLRALG